MDPVVLPYILSRKQFQIRLCFVMTINKSQGQPFKRVDIDLRQPVFSYGQFYVAVSRTSSVADLHILSLFPDRQLAINESYSEVLDNLNKG